MIRSKAVKAKSKKRRYLIVFKSGERVEIKMKDEEKLQKWLATGVAGVVTRSKNIKLSPDTVKEIIDITKEASS
jgi:hypothetical protein